MTPFSGRYLLNCLRSKHTLSNGFKNTPVRVRFAPSPTGKMHIGGLRMAFYNYIFAHQRNGKFILRIEDTDQSRYVPGSVEEIEDTLEWAGLTPDESPRRGGIYGPYVQTERLDMYKEKALELLDRGRAYRCFCSKLRLELMRRQQAKNREPLGYDRKCRHLSESEVREMLDKTEGKFAVRLATDTENADRVICTDLIFGAIKGRVMNDPVILKSDSYPTYHLANVIDDHAMEITHVLRGSEWISSLTTHIELYDAFGWTAPQYAHFPLINCPDGSKMSKRNKDSTVESWIQKGYDNLAMLNFLTNFGGGLPTEKLDANEIWSKDEIINGFDFSRVIRHPATADIDRLNLYSAKELRKTLNENPTQLVQRMKNLLIKNDIDCKFSDQEIEKVLRIFVDRIVNLNDLVDHQHAFIWGPPDLTWRKDDYQDKNWDLEHIVRFIIKTIEENGIEDKKLLDSKFKEFVSLHKLQWSNFMKLIRKLITNNDEGLPVYELFSYIGKDRLIEYLENSIDHIKKLPLLV